MYESPIDKIVQHIQENLIKQEEDHLMEQITETVGYQINKEELIKALKYDRNQYHIGFEDARKMYETSKGEWIPISSIDEIPKEGAYWVTFEYENGYRETSHIWRDTFRKHWNDEEGWALDNENYVIAYMPYFEPKPYNPKSEQ